MRVAERLAGEHPAVTSIRRRLVIAGLADDVADAIIRTQPIPDRLLRALARTDATDATRNVRAA